MASFPALCIQAATPEELRFEQSHRPSPGAEMEIRRARKRPSSVKSDESSQASPWQRSLQRRAKEGKPTRSSDHNRELEPYHLISYLEELLSPSNCARFSD